MQRNKIQIFAIPDRGKGPYLWAPLNPRKWKEPLAKGFNQDRGYLTMSGAITEEVFRLMDEAGAVQGLRGAQGMFQLIQGEHKILSDEIKSKLKLGYRYFGEMDLTKISLELMNNQGHLTRFSGIDLNLAFLRGYKQVMLTPMPGGSSGLLTPDFMEPVWA